MIETDLATALTRARKARLPSPWTGRGILEWEPSVAILN